MIEEDKIAHTIKSMKKEMPFLTESSLYELKLQRYIITAQEYVRHNLSLVEDLNFDTDVIKNSTLSIKKTQSNQAQLTEKMRELYNTWSIKLLKYITYNPQKK
jgi:transcription termination factor NusB